MEDQKLLALNHKMFPESSITVIVKFDGKVYSKGVLFGDLKADQGLYVAMAQGRRLSDELQQTLFHHLGGRSASVNCYDWYNRKKTEAQLKDKLAPDA